MDYHLYLLRPDESGNPQPLKPFLKQLGRLRFNCDDDVETSGVLLDIQELIKPYQAVAGYVGREVIVTEINQNLHEQWVAGVGPDVKPRSNEWRPSKPVEYMQRFVNARAASAWLGFNNNDVSIYLSNAAKKFPNVGDRRVYLRGVQFMYWDDYVNGSSD